MNAEEIAARIAEQARGRRQDAEYAIAVGWIRALTDDKATHRVPWFSDGLGRGIFLSGNIDLLFRR